MGPRYISCEDARWMEISQNIFITNNGDVINTETLVKL
jgi:hypothetical protein